MARESKVDLFSHGAGVEPGGTSGIWETSACILLRRLRERGFAVDVKSSSGVGVGVGPDDDDEGNGASSPSGESDATEAESSGITCPGRAEMGCVCGWA